MDKDMDSMTKAELRKYLSAALQSLTLIAELHPTLNKPKDYVETVQFLADCGLRGEFPAL